METVIRYFSGLAIIGGLIALLGQVHAQTTAISIQSFRSGSAGELETMLQAVETTTPLAAELVPKFGNLYSAQNPNWPPLPGNTIDAPNIANFGSDSADDPVNFYDYITWNSQLCCDTNNFWHWHGRWKVDQTPQVTFTDLGLGSINLPTNSFYPPP